MSHSDLSSFSSGQTERVVGRDNELKKIKKYLSPKSTARAVFFIGDGGLGKTRLLKETVKLAEIRHLAVTKDLIDLNLIGNHSREGLQKSIAKALNRDAFARYDQLEKQLREIPMGDFKGKQEQRELIGKTFLEELAALASKQRVVIALDTAERLVYSEGDTQAQGSATPKGTARVADSWEWFEKEFHNWPNVLVFIAGRTPNTEILYNRLVSDTPVQTIDIKEFDDADSTAFLQEVANKEKDKGNKAFANQIETIIRIKGKQLYKVTEGRPILLGMATALLKITDLDTFMRVVDEAANVESSSMKAETKGGLKIPPPLEKALYKILEELNLPEVLETLLALGRLPKGANVELLTALVGKTEDVETGLRVLKKIDPIYVKLGEKNPIYFLHDEMYLVLQRQVYDKQPADGFQKDQAERLIESYYVRQLSRTRSEMRQRIETLAATTTGALIEKQEFDDDQHVSLQTEFLFYTLRQDSAKGFRLYCRYLLEAVISGNYSDYALYESELLSFVFQDPRFNADKLPGISKWLLELVIAERAAINALMDGEWARCIEGLNSARRILKEQGQETRVLADSLLEVWEAWTYANRGNLTDLTVGVKLHLEDVPENLRNYLRGPREDDLKWLAKVILGLAYRVWAFRCRAMGELKGARESYQQAINYLDSEDTRTILAVVRNELALTHADLGEYPAARSLLEQARAIESEFGTLYPIGLNYNTLALIDAQEQKFEDALKNAETALSFFGAIPSRRGVALANRAFAEIYRRNAAMESGSIIARQDSLRQAKIRIEPALQIFNDLNEELRYIDALIELGCIWRDLAALESSDSSFIAEYAENAHSCFRDVIANDSSTTDKVVVYKKVEALVNLAILEYNLKNMQAAQSAVEQALETVGGSYIFVTQGGRTTGEKKDTPVTGFFRLLGKLHVLEGHIFLDAYQELSQRKVATRTQLDDARKTAAEKYLHALQYYLLFNAKFPELEQAKAEIASKLGKLRSTELEDFTRKVEELEGTWGFKPSELRKMMMDHGLWEKI